MPHCLWGEILKFRGGDSCPACGRTKTLSHELQTREAHMALHTASGVECRPKATRACGNAGRARDPRGEQGPRNASGGGKAPRAPGGWLHALAPGGGRSIRAAEGTGPGAPRPTPGAAGCSRGGGRCTGSGRRQAAGPAPPSALPRLKREAQSPSVDTEAQGQAAAQGARGRPAPQVGWRED